MRITLCALLLVAASLPCLAGDIEGKVELKAHLGDHKGGKQKAAPESAGGVQYKAGSGARNELGSTVVFLEGAELKCTPMAKRTRDNEMLQKDKEFIPYVLAVPRGSSVFFENKDNFKHHVYSESEPGAFELPAFTGVKAEIFEKSNTVEVFCGIHTKMNAYVLVTDNDFFTKPDGSSGRYRLRGVPAGTYKIKVWHPRAAQASVETVTVPASGAVKLDLTL